MQLTETQLEFVGIMRYKAHTDADFLGSTAGEFMALIQAIVDALTE